MPQALDRGLRGMSPNKHSPSGGVLCVQNAVLAILESWVSALWCSYFRNNYFSDKVATNSTKSEPDPESEKVDTCSTRSEPDAEPEAHAVLPSVVTDSA